MAIYSSQDSSIAPASAWLKTGRRCDPQVNHRPNSEVFKAQGPRFKPCRRNKNDHASSGSSINIGRNWMTTPWTKWAVAEELSTATASKLEFHIWQGTTLIKHSLSPERNQGSESLSVNPPEVKLQMVDLFMNCGFQGGRLLLSHLIIGSHGPPWLFHAKKMIKKPSS